VLRPLHFLHLTHLRDVVVAISPHTIPELALWMLVSASAGICEEFIFRGYLLRQVLSWSGSNAVAVGVTAILFGSMHFYEGTAAAIQIASLGVWFGAVAVRQRSLRQVAIAHFLQDAIAGLALFLHR
jgi:membrane protease YdiL (CAAX protease family)